MSNPITLSLRDIAGWQIGKLLDPPAKTGCIARLPSLQRAAVWKPWQVELMWDSFFRSFPIGVFVVAKPLHTQQSRLGAYADDEWAPDGEVTHHLLDGQQRANAITLGFYDPFDPQVQHHKNAKRLPILWLDLSDDWTSRGDSVSSSRGFLFRLITEAHPWGYSRSDDGRRISYQRMREALREVQVQ